jgi:ketosteroid isomerase-like protein
MWRVLPLIVASVMTVQFLAPARADAAAVRSASRSLVEAWNRHDVKAWTAYLADDVWYTETNDSLYQRNKGREAAVGRFADSVENSDLHWEIIRVKTRPDGVVSVVLVQRMSMLPKTDGKYRAAFTSDPALARWRLDADRRWRVVFFTSHEGWARAEAKKDDEGAVVAAATPSAPIASPAAPRAKVGSEPKEYTAFWGRLAHGCNFCHGRPPALPSSEIASRIVSVGAATSNGAELRIAMKRKDLGEVMDLVLADPALDDDALEAVRRYLVDVRDGWVPEQIIFDAAGATRELQIRNERSSRDVPATIAILKVMGPFAIDTQLSTCRGGGVIDGQAACRLVIRALTDAARSQEGAVELQLSGTKDLSPRARRTALRIGS